MTYSVIIGISRIFQEMRKSSDGRFWRFLVLVVFGIHLNWMDLAAGELSLRFKPVIQGVEVRKAQNYQIGSSGLVEITRLDLLISSIGFQLKSGEWIQSSNTRNYISLDRGKFRCEFNNVPLDGIKSLRFFIGLPKSVNQLGPGDFDSSDPIFPVINELHWGWQGGFVFCALEGRIDNWTKEGKFPLSFHLAQNENLVPIEIDIPINKILDRGEVEIELDLWKVLRLDSGLELLKEKAVTHSRDGDPVLPDFKIALANSFTAKSATIKEFGTISTPRIESKAHISSTPLVIKLGRHFPPLPPIHDNPLTAEGVQLGKELFHEQLLSKDQSISCASCHDPAHAFVDPKMALSKGVEGTVGHRNSMSLMNLAWSKSFFWDGRVKELRKQVLEPIQAEHEMNASLDLVINRLHKSNKYKKLFKNAFKDELVSIENLALALEQFLISQVSTNSKFDQAIAGVTELSPIEKRGLELFVTEHDPAKGLFGADCFHCHGGPLFTNQLLSNNGLESQSSDLGEELITGNKNDRFKFKAPTLRNIAVTAPYMHDGRFRSLAEVVEHYNSGVVRHQTLDPNLAKHPIEGLNLSKDDQKALVAFLRTLTDQKFQDLLSD